MMRAGGKRRLSVVSHSELETLRSCPALWGYRYADGLVLKVKPRAPALGTILHEGLRAVYRAFPAVQASRAGIVADGQTLIAAGVAAVDRALADWRSTMDRADISDSLRGELLEDANETSEMLHWMVSHYVRAQAVGDLDRLRIVQIEQRFEAEIYGKPPEHAPPLDRAPTPRRTGLRYRGVMDLVMLDVVLNALVLMEHKTGVGSPADAERRILMDPQTSGYVYALGQLRDAGKLVYQHPAGVSCVPADAQVGRTLINSFRRARPRQPQVNKDGKVSAAAIDTIPSLYQAALDEQRDVRGIPVTAAQLDRLQQLIDRGDVWMMRIEHFRTPAEVERWRSETLIDARRIRQAERDPAYRTRNIGHCTMPWSRPCDYARVCLDPSEPEHRREFDVRERAHHQEEQDGEKTEQ